MADRQDDRDRDRHFRQYTDRERSRSPDHRREANLRNRRRSRSPTQKVRKLQPLPNNAPLLSKHDYVRCKSLFAHYLDLQKQLTLEDLDEREARGRWKSFIGKWNRGELAEGWYDSERLNDGGLYTASAVGNVSEAIAMRSNPGEYWPSRSNTKATVPTAEGSDDDDDDFGPSLPPGPVSIQGQRLSAAIPSIQDLELQREQARDDRDAAAADLRLERKDFRKREQARLDELAPKAEAGTRERQQEKRRDAAAANRSFAATKTDAGGDVEVRDDELMGGGDAVDEYRRARKEMERKKNERELRREEILRARQAERAERVRAYKAKEEKAMEGLIALAKQKYG